MHWPQQNWKILPSSVKIYVNIFSAFLGCYQLLSPGRRLTDPSVSQSFDLESNQECMHKCDEAEFECIAYSFG